jgi:hypothetical protein
MPVNVSHEFASSVPTAARVASTRSPAARSPRRRGRTQNFIPTAAHALVSMAAREAADALALDARSDDPDLRRLEEIWSDGS